MDWEALLQQSPAQFITSLSSWLLPPEALAQPGAGQPGVSYEQDSGAANSKQGTGEGAGSGAEVSAAHKSFQRSQACQARGYPHCQIASHITASGG